MKTQRKKPQPNAEERAKLKYWFFNNGRTLKSLSGVFKCSAQQIGQAFDGSQPGLINKIKTYAEKLEAAKSKNENTIAA
jgi:hypothetical protein